MLKQFSISKSLLINGLFFLVLIFVFGCYWESNDDISMMFIASGKYGIAPSEFLVFQNIIIGKSYKTLYSYFPNGMWYSILTIILYWFCISIIHFQLFKKLKHWSHLFIAIFYLLYFIKVIIICQFTTLSALCFIAASSILFIDKKENNIGLLIICFLLFTISSLIRFELFAMLLIVFSVYAISKILQKKFFEFKFLVFVVLIAVALKAYDYNYNRKTEQLKEYQIFNANRAFFQDARIDYLKNKKVFDQVGWTENDHNIFSGFMGDYSNKFSNKNLSFINQNAKTQKPSLLNNIIELKTFMILLCFILILFYQLINSNTERLILIGSFAVIALICVGVNYFGFALKSRVSVSLKMYLFIASLFLINKQAIQKINYKKFFIPFSLLFLYTTVHAYHGNMFNILNRNKKYSKNALENFTALKNFSSTKEVLINVPNNIQTNNISIFELDKCKAKSKQVEIGWMAHSPTNEKILQSFNKNLHSIWDENEIAKKFIYTATIQDKQTEKMIKEFIQQNYHKNYHFVEDSLLLKNNFKLYSLTATPVVKFNLLSFDSTAYNELEKSINKKSINNQ